MFLKHALPVPAAKSEVVVPKHTPHARTRIKNKSEVGRDYRAWI